MDENERIVCEFLRKIAPQREWEYLGEVEHYWIGELCDELNKQLKAENAKLRELLLEAYEAATEPDCGVCHHVETCNEMLYCVKWVELEHRMRDELGIEVK